MSVGARVVHAPAIAERGSLAPLVAVVAVGLALRLAFIGSDGFHNDVGAFESWTLTLRDNPTWAFYAKSGFADYPPGYFVVLWLLAKLYALLPGAAADSAHGFALLRAVIKLPAIAMDLADTALVFAIARRFAAPAIALLAAAALAFNPAAIYVSAYWGQIDSVSWGLVLLSVLMLMRAGDDRTRTLSRVTWAWLALAASVLMKPQAAAVGALLLAYPFATGDAAVRSLRLRGTACGFGAAMLLAVAVGLLFHPSADVIGWLFGRYAFGSAVYPYTSVNAFNLYAIRGHLWQPDTIPLALFGVSIGTPAIWGIGLVVASTVLVAWRYRQLRDDRALLIGALLCVLAFFDLATRMHERYVYGAFLLALPLIAVARSGAVAAVLLTVTMYLNLAYSLAYQTVMEQKIGGVDAGDLWPSISHPAAFTNVALFFWLGYRYLATEPSPAAFPAQGLVASLRSLIARGRAWFDPREGIVAMTRADWLIAGGVTLASFVLCVAWLQYPADKIFDEIYFARAGEEYLKHADVSGWGPFEFTHPPLTKLVITLSMLLFGGLHGLGNTAVGWRFLNVVIGALTVALIYVFAKRLTASAMFATLAAAMLALDGLHFVQSRIATPEITVAFLSLLSLYAFYRLWLGTNVARRVPLAARAARRPLLVTMVVGVVAAAVVALLVPKFSGPVTIRGVDFVGWAQAVASGWTLALFWLVARTIVAPRAAAASAVTSYADGTRVAGTPPAVISTPPDADDAELVRTVDDGATLAYATPVASATYRPDATATIDGVTSRATDARVWWIVLPLAIALLADAKWNGLFDMFVVLFIAAVVGAQRWIPLPARFGNPFGVPVDVIAAAIVVAGGIVYTLSYVPYFTQGHGFVDMVAMQHDMYRYHSTLVATHPWSSVWWQWPILDRPILYYYADSRAVTQGAQAEHLCCISTILALPNPFVWWAGLVSVPLVAWWGIRERNKGYLLLAVAYLFQWLPWIGSPRLSFEYHFFPNLAIIVLANAVVLQRVWTYGREQDLLWPRMAVGAYAAAVVLGFAFFYPVLAGAHIPWDLWHARMWSSRWAS